MTDRLQARVAVFLILYQGGQILILKRKNTPYYPDHYSVPAGHVEVGETPFAAIIRETREEVGVDVTDRVKFCGVAYRQDFGMTYVDFIFAADWWPRSGQDLPEPFNAETDKAEDVHWCWVDQLPTAFVPHVAEMVENRFNGISYSHWPTELT